ncbi:MAG TPA: metallophosphoesterase, partial [Kofleriaceae bacterium]|nr:metallophosphoesterase [Kofleriaceae bacterium]
MIGWVTVAPAGQRVDVTTPDGRAVAAVTAAREAVVVRASGESQMWARLEALEPGTIYCYALAGDGGALSGRIGFRTAPPPDGPEPVRFLAFGDSGGGGADQRALAKQMLSVPYDLIVHTGDIAYDDGTIGQYEDNVFGIYAPLFQHLPFFPASGNHDYRTLSAAPFRAVFALPGTDNEKWYSYDWGRVHFVALDTESDYATQARWLDADLAATARPWKIVYFHKPPFSSGSHGSDAALRSALAPVFEQHRVQLVLAGHDHNYERVRPQNGVAYVVTGGGGVGTRPVGTSSFTELSLDVIHFVYGEVGADRLVLHAIDGVGAEFDSVVIPRE